MMRRQFARTQGVFMGDIEGADGPGTQRVRNEFRRRLRKRQRAEGKLDGDFPRAGRREIQLRGRRGQEVFGPQIEFVLGRKAPEKDARVEQTLHWRFLAFPERFFFRPSNNSSTASGNGESKSSGTLSCPRKIPRTRCVFFGGTGTRRATGTPRLAMVISSPAATRRRSCESWVFASCVFTSFMSVY